MRTIIFQKSAFWAKKTPQRPSRMVAAYLLYYEKQLLLINLNQTNMKL